VTVVARGLCVDDIAAQPDPIPILSFGIDRNRGYFESLLDPLQFVDARSRSLTFRLTDSTSRHNALNSKQGLVRRRSPFCQDRAASQKFPQELHLKSNSFDTSSTSVDSSKGK
jgi:hypothetical protein